MHNNVVIQLLCMLVLLHGSLPLHAMGLRSFVALPVDKGGSVARLSIDKNTNTETSVLIANYAYGLSHNQTLLTGLPYRLSPAGSNHTGDISILYRHIVLQSDQQHGTHRVGLLAGLIAATDSARDDAIQLGFVDTLYQQRHELDFDMLYQAGLDNRKDSGRYDLSWQYRLAPTAYPDWGVGTQWNSVLELNGRWIEDIKITHQVTAGLQWIHPEWVLEGGIVRDINNNHETHIIISTRIHF